MDPTKCNKCALGYHIKDYGSVKFCCRDGYYCNNLRVSTFGNILNCQIYDTNVDDCI